MLTPPVLPQSPLPAPVMTANVFTVVIDWAAPNGAYEPVMMPGLNRKLTYGESAVLLSVSDVNVTRLRLMLVGTHLMFSKKPPVVKGTLVLARRFAQLLMPAPAMIPLPTIFPLTGI